MQCSRCGESVPGNCAIDDKVVCRNCFAILKEVLNARELTPQDWRKEPTPSTNPYKPAPAAGVPPVFIVIGCLSVLFGFPLMIARNRTPSPPPPPETLTERRNREALEKFKDEIAAKRAQAEADAEIYGKLDNIINKDRHDSDSE